MTRVNPQHGAPSPDSATRKKRKWPWIVCGILGALVALGAIANAVNLSPKPEQTPVSPAPAAPPPSAAAPSSTSAPNAAVPSAPARSAQPDWIKICKITEGNGTFYLNISSAAAHNFTECGIAPAFYSGTIEDLLKLPGMDRRCLTGNADVAQEQAVIGVYSDTKRADLAVAKAFCSTKGWPNE
jgi:hypothetical protein